MPRNKLYKYAALERSKLAITIDREQKDEKLDLVKVFSNNNPVILELGAGYGEYSVKMARRNPSNNYIAIDIKSDRLWKGAELCERESITNIRFIRSDIHRVDEMFFPDSIDDIWLTFSDPQPNKPKKRLSHERFLAKYAKIQKNKSPLFIKTDSQLLFESTIESVERFNSQKSKDSESPMYRLEVVTEHPSQEQTLGITTRYEDKFSALGHTIKFIALRLDKSNQ